MILTAKQAETKLREAKALLQELESADIVDCIPTDITVMCAQACLAWASARMVYDRFEITSRANDEFAAATVVDQFAKSASRANAEDKPE